ncbi:hypothetical protein C0J29_00745 [Mycobacterium paragordonae]|uniref:MMPL family transporter n=1 Tax=Mycobacterium paragordonae TaxID=1389713 RepID=UPI000EAA16BB|nr:hypothetical protein C0J29_00745 [Mycobacterium paragordonae]
MLILFVVYRTFVTTLLPLLTIGISLIPTHRPYSCSRDAATGRRSGVSVMAALRASAANAA